MTYHASNKRMLIRTTVLGAVALASLAACQKPSAEQPGGAGKNGELAAATPIRLDPMTEADRQEFGSGCSCGFQTATAELMQYGPGREGGDRVAMRVNGQLLVCAIDQAAAEVISAGEGAFACGGYRVSLTPKGAVEQGNDSHGRDATLTLSLGDRSASVEGGVGCAC